MTIGENPTEVQRMIDLYTTTFAWIGLKMNAVKIKALIMNGGKISSPLSVTSYERMVTGVGETFQQKRKQTTICKLCGTQL